MEMDAMDSPQDQGSRVELTSTTLKVYKQRWFLLATLCMLNLSNALTWLAFGPVAFKAAGFYHTDVDTINWLSVIFMITGIPCGVVATWLIDVIGLRFSVILGAWLNLIGCALRVVSAIPNLLLSARLPLVFVGQTLAAFAQPFILFAPTKLAALWFKEDQRAVANMLATISNPLGIMLCNILSPILLSTSSEMLLMLGVESIPALLAVDMATFGWRSSKPPTPPSPSAETDSESFWVGIKSLFRNRQYWLLGWTVGAGVALFSVLTTLLSQILCPWGYSDFFVGVVCGSVLIGFGFVGSAIAGVIVDHTKRFTEIVKIGFAVAILALVAFAVLHNYTGQWVPLGFVCGVFGLFGIPVYPVGNELAVETTYPVGEATSSGIVFMSGQLQGIILVLVMQSIGTPLSNTTAPKSLCNSDNLGNIPETNMSVPVYVMTAYAGLVGIVFLIFFRTKYHRHIAELGEDNDKCSGTAFHRGQLSSNQEN